jgi:hypothetical protein
MADVPGQVEIAAALGAEEEFVSTKVLTLYIPNKTQANEEFGTQRQWVLEAGELLARMGGGFTIMPPVEGGWVNNSPEDGGERRVLWENPVLIYAYVHPKEFAKSLPALREFVHRLGRETNQGEVAVEYDGRFYRIRDFDAGEEGASAGPRLVKTGDETPTEARPYRGPRPRH